MNDPLAAVPIRPSGVEMRLDSLGNVHLCRRMPVGGLRKLLRQEHRRMIELDEFGSRYYRLVDGRHTLREIVEQLVEQSGRARKDVEEGVVVFTKQLMIKHFLQLEVAA